MEFNRIIKLLRKERGITQKQAAEDLVFRRPCCPTTKKASGSAGWTLWCAWPTIIMFPATICWAAAPSATV